MAKVYMAQVYRQIYDERLEDIRIAAQNGKEVILYSFKDFSTDVRRNDLLTSVATIKDKWDNAVADRIICEWNGSYSNGWLVYEALQRYLRIPSKKCVCMCVPKVLNNTSGAVE